MTTYTARAMYHILEVQGAEQWLDVLDSRRPRGDRFGNLLASLSDLPVVVYTGISSGPVTVDLEFFESPPVPKDGFDVVVEGSVLARGGRFGLRGMDDPVGLVDEHGLNVPAGWLRMRIHGRCRDIAYDEAVHVPVEHYVIQVWAQSPSPAVDLKTGEQMIDPNDLPIVGPRRVRVVSG